MYDKFAQTTHQMQFNNEFLLRKMFPIETVPIMRHNICLIKILTKHKHFIGYKEILLTLFQKLK